MSWNVLYACSRSRSSDYNGASCLCITFILLSPSDLQGMKTYAKQDGDDWILNGSKVFISNGYLAGLVVVTAVTNPSAKSPAHGMSLFLVEEGMPGFRKGKILRKMGLKAQVRVVLIICQLWFVICMFRHQHYSALDGGQVPLSFEALILGSWS